MFSESSWPKIQLECLPDGNWAHEATEDGEISYNDSILLCLYEIEKYNTYVERHGRFLYSDYGVQPTGEQQGTELQELKGVMDQRFYSHFAVNEVLIKVQDKKASRNNGP